MACRFELSEKQEQQIAAWDKEQDALMCERQLAEGIYTGSIREMLEEGVPYYGAIGGALTFAFTPTSLGVVVKVTHGGTGAELDVTEYDLW